MSDIQFARALTGTLQISNIFNSSYETNGYTYGGLYTVYDENDVPVGKDQYHVNYYYPQAGINFLFQLKWEF